MSVQVTIQDTFNMTLEDLISIAPNSNGFSIKVPATWNKIKVIELAGTQLGFNNPIEWI